MKRIALIALAGSLCASASALAYDVTDNFSIGGVLSTAGQCQILNDDAESSDECRGAIPIQPEVSFRPTDNDEIFFKLGFAAGNTTNKVSPFALGTWGADLEDDVKDINGRNRDYLLTGWYKHNFQFDEDKSLGVTVGIIDARDYLADNGYADDEYTQFMNEVFVNSSNTFVFSYDAGGVLEADYGPFSLRGVYMNVGRNDNDKNFDYGAIQLGYTADTRFGEGYYSVLFDFTSNDFASPDDDGDEETSQVLLFNAGQELGDVFAVWGRFAWQNNDTAATYYALYSGGVNIVGSPWGRADDNIGIGYAYLDGGNQNLTFTQVAEAYYRFVFNDYLALTADVQYMHDKVRDGQSPKGVILGLRAVTEF